MKDRGNKYFQRAEEAVDRLITFAEQEVELTEVTLALVGLAQAEASLILAESQRLLAETLIEAIRLERIRLSLGELEPHEFSGEEPLPANSPAVAKP